MKNWKTMLAGFLAGLPIAIEALLSAYQEGTFTGKTGSHLVLAIGIIIFGIYAKDKNVTGGTTPQ
jgi:hypothetical protein